MISNKPCIAISLRIVKAQNYDETRDALSHDWPQFLENLGIIPIYIPNNLLNVKNYLSAFEIDGLILSGGDNLGTDPVRDKTETELLQYAMSKNIPTLGICRGLQLINQYFGGSITENNSDSHVGTKHHLDIVDKKDREMIIGLFYTIGYGSSSISVTIIGFLIDKYESFTPAFFLIAILGIFATIILFSQFLNRRSNNL